MVQILAGMIAVHLRRLKSGREAKFPGGATRRMLPDAAAFAWFAFTFSSFLLFFSFADRNGCACSHRSTGNTWVLEIAWSRRMYIDKPPAVVLPGGLNC